MTGEKEEAKGSGLSASQVAAAGAATAVVTIGSSYWGRFGTLAGAVLTSTVTTAGPILFKHWFSEGAKRARRLKELRGKYPVYAAKAAAPGSRPRVPRRGLQPLHLLAAGGVCAGVLGGVTAAEAIANRPVSAIYHRTSGGGTTLFGGGASSATTPPPTSPPPTESLRSPASQTATAGTRSPSPSPSSLSPSPSPSKAPLVSVSPTVTSASPSPVVTSSP